MHRYATTNRLASRELNVGDKLLMNTLEALLLDEPSE